MIIRIGVDIRFFLLVLLLVLLGFSQAFWLLSSMDSAAPFGTVPSSLLNSFLFMLGNFNAEFDGTASPVIATMLLVLFLLFMSILMLNLLIALMGESFNRVSSNGLGFWRLELASTLLEQRHLLSENFDENAALKCLYVVKYTSAIKFQEVLDNHKFESESSVMYGKDFGDNIVTTGQTGPSISSGGQSSSSAVARCGPTAFMLGDSASTARIASLEAKIDKLEANINKLLEALETSKR
jgi:hypothetical protein